MYKNIYTIYCGIVTRKYFSKPLDKFIKVCYNNYTVNGKEVVNMNKYDDYELLEEDEEHEDDSFYNLEEDSTFEQFFLNEIMGW